MLLNPTDSTYPESAPEEPISTGYRKKVINSLLKTSSK